VVTRKRPVRHPTATEDVGPARAVAGPAGALLLVDLGTRARDLGPGLHLVGPGPALGELPEHHAVEDVGTHLDAKDGVGELDRSHLLGGKVPYCDLHDPIPRPPPEPPPCPRMGR
jgi:hypothetical protein